MILDTKRDDSITKLLLCSETNFVELTKVAGLNPARDYVGSDLSRVDFSNCDLRGYNFSDANLSFAFGIGVTFDSTTILTGSTVTSSCFALEKEIRDTFSNDLSLAPLLNKLKKEYWANGALWISDNIRRGKKNFTANTVVAKALFGEITDATYKNQILYFLKDAFHDRSSYRDFLLSQIRDPLSTYRVIRSALEILSRVFKNDAYTSELILSYLSHPNAEIRKICVPVATSPRLSASVKSAVYKAIIDEEDPAIRRLYVKSVCMRIGKDAEDMFYDERTKSFFDFAEPLDNDTLIQMVRGFLLKRKREIRAEGIQHFSVENRDYYINTLVSDAEARSMVPQLEYIVRVVSDAGVPLRRQYDLLTAADRVG